VLLGLMLLLGIGVSTQVASAQETGRGWVFTSLPQADLWFHGMALVDPIGPGPNPLYDPGYPNEIRRAKEGAGSPSTVLDTRLGYFRDAFQRDAAFEVLHFLPLYFPRAGRAEFFAALKVLVQAEEGIPRAPSAHTAFGLAAVSSVLTTRAQRSVLGEFVSALEAEWDSFFGEFWRTGVPQRNQILSSLQEVWGSVYSPALGPFLDGMELSGGAVALVPAIGVDGRIFGGSPQVSTDNVLVVSAPTGPERSSEAIYSMLRELSFPLARRVMDRGGRVVGNQGEEESLASRAAIRSGALILKRYRPGDVPDYQRFFLSQAGRTAPAEAAVEAAFRETFPLKDGFEQALREEIFTIVTNGGVG